MQKGNPKDIFFQKMVAFSNESKSEFEKVEQVVKDMQKGYEDLATYFGEEKSGDVVAIAHGFSRDFLQATEDNIKAKKMKERLAKKAMQASVMNKRKNLVSKAEENVQQNAKFMVGANHVELRKRLQRNRQTHTNRKERGGDINAEMDSSIQP